MNEYEAIERLRRGQISGLGALVERYQVQAVRAAYLVTQDQEAAQDIVQNAFLRVFRSIGSFDPARPFGAWFMRIVVNDALKAATRGRRVEPADAETADMWLESLPDPGPMPETAAEAAELEQQVWTAVQTLSPELRAVVAMRYYLELSEQEMAQRLSVPAGTIKSRLHAARRSLRKLLAARLPEWEA
ncbi:MAG: sigma-70 family RNA polymerase sigma factor [Chloroflexi bacterium]|nr:sigma-70 family RNA polymerase sigma factor [Chloroflexota bacterium]